MPRFFVDPFDNDRCVIGGEDARHIAKSLRMDIGDEITLCDGQGTDYEGEIAAIETGAVTVQVLGRYSSQSEPAVRIRLYQALAKGDKLELIVQKAVELGVTEIIPVLTDRCISRPDPNAMEKKRVRLQRIAQESAMQSERGIVPAVLPLQRFQEGIGGMKQSACAILLYERATAPLSGILSQRPKEVALMVGCEGGFSPEEAAFAAGQGIPLVSLGKRILRCETAPLCALSAILFASGEF